MEEYYKKDTQVIKQRPQKAGSHLKYNINRYRYKYKISHRHLSALSLKQLTNILATESKFVKDNLFSINPNNIFFRASFALNIKQDTHKQVPQID